MPPKKRDKDVDSSKAPRTDTAQADHELFLQAFEKPTQIYRFLRTRNQLSPVFLTRTLTYMRDRLSRNNQARKTFKVDSLLERLKNKRSSLSSEIMSGYMNLTFLGFYDKTLESHPANAQVETVLLKISHKKRKDSSSASMEVSFGTKEVPINPNETSPPLKVPTTSIPTDSFCLSDGSLSKSYILLLHVRYPLSETLPQNEDEPALKRRKSSGPGSNGNVIQRDSGYEQKLYGSELVVYDKHNRCLLSNGDYELVLDEVASTYKNSPRKAFSWDDFQSTDLIVEKYEPFECFTKKPLIKFNLSWSQEPAHSMVDRPQPYLPSENKENVVPAKKLQERSGQSQKDQLGSTATNGSVNGCSALKEESPRRLQIIYQFVYNNNSRQQTEACEDLHCPWCSLNCLSLYPLLKHLKLCHSRFVFTYVPIPQGARIDCAINELYDGSYSGSPHDLAAQPAAVAFSRNGPVRRAQVTNILVCRPKRPRPTLSEFLEPDDSELYDGQRPYITGHNRLYHHTTTCLPIYPKEMDVDSEGENDPEWLQHKTAMMIDEFTDVNEGEKELMKMWNLHVMRHGFVGDCQIPLACTMFLQAKGRELLMKNLYRNFILHLCSLFDFGLISPITLYGTVKKLHELVGETAAIRQVLLDSRVAQRDNWAATHSAIAASTSAGTSGSQTSNNEKKEQNPKSLSVNNSCITPNKNSGRKVGTPSGAAQLRRKSAPPTQTTELPPRRRSGSSINEPVSKKRLSLSLKKDESLGGKALSS